MKESSAARLAGQRANAPKTKEPKRPPFNFEKEKPMILSSVAGASQSANNLINAIRVSLSLPSSFNWLLLVCELIFRPLSCLQLVNREKENVTENARVQKYLEEAKQARRKVIRYIQVCPLPSRRALAACERQA
jgi:hypothetical protein